MGILHTLKNIFLGKRRKQKEQLSTDNPKYQFTIKRISEPKNPCNGSPKSLNPEYAFISDFYLPTSSDKKLRESTFKELERDINLFLERTKPNINNTNSREINPEYLIKDLKDLKNRMTNFIRKDSKYTEIDDISKNKYSLDSKLHIRGKELEKKRGTKKQNSRKSRSQKTL